MLSCALALSIISLLMLTQIVVLLVGRARRSIYRHKKTDNLYRVLHVGCMTEGNKESHVVYQRVDRSEDVTVWIRPYTMFMDGRFEHVSGPII